MGPSARLLAVLLVGTSGCASSAHEAEVRALRERLEALQVRVGRQETQVTELQNQLFLVNDQLSRDRVTADVARPPARLQVVRLTPPAPPPGPVEIEAPAIDVTLDGYDEPNRLSVAHVPPPPDIPRHDGAEADGLFRDALAAFREGRGKQAAELFSKFVERYPDHAYADKALYWLGESRFEGGAHAEAVAIFRKLQTRYPRSSKLPDALFRLGVSCERLGATAEARQAFTDLTTNFPASALAELARARLGGEPGGAR